MAELSNPEMGVASKTTACESHCRRPVSGFEGWKGPMKIEYHEYPLDLVMRYFADGFTGKDKMDARLREWFIDPVKGMAVFRLYVGESKKGRR